jgi:integrase
VASVWIARYTAADGSPRHRVYYRLGGREYPPRYAGSFRVHRDALARKAWVTGELAAQRVPDVRALTSAEPARAPTVAEAAKRWQASRVDWAEATRTAARGNIRRALPYLGARRLDELTPADAAGLVVYLHEHGARRETIRKSLGALAMVLDHAEVTPNAFRNKTAVRLPREEAEEINPPTAAHVAGVLRVIATKYRLPLVVLDATGMRVGELEGLRWGDVDEPRGRWRVRAELNHNRRARWVEPRADVFAAVVALTAREDRDPAALVFAGDANQAALRTAVTRACKHAGVPHWHPHDLRHRRVSLLHREGVVWAHIGALVGQKDIAVTANTYTHVLMDDAEISLAEYL